MTGLENLVDADSLNKLQSLQQSLERLYASVQESAVVANKLLAEFEEVRSSQARRKAAIEDSARQLRLKIESSREGAGKIAGQLGQVQEQIALAKNIDLQISNQVSKASILLKEISDAVSRIQAHRQQRFKIRQTVANNLNQNLHPTVSVEISHLAQLDEYVEALKETMRGIRPAIQ